MALKKTITLVDNFGEQIVFENAYIQAAKVETSKNASFATVLVRRSPNAQVLETRMAEFCLDLNGPNPIKQAYEHLKTLPEFEGAEDC